MRSLLNISLTVLELVRGFGWYSHPGSRQNRLRTTTKAKQATVSLLDNRDEVTTLDWDKRLDLEIPL